MFFLFFSETDFQSLVIMYVLQIVFQYLKETISVIYKFPLAPMGVLANGAAHSRPSALPPIDTSGNFWVHVSAESPSKFSKKKKGICIKLKCTEDIISCGFIKFK